MEKKEKTYTEIITDAAKQIKTKATKDLKKLKEELNKPLFSKKEDKSTQEAEKTLEQPLNDDKSSIKAPSKDSKQKETPQVKDSPSDAALKSNGSSNESPSNSKAKEFKEPPKQVSSVSKANNKSKESSKEFSSHLLKKDKSKESSKESSSDLKDNKKKKGKKILGIIFTILLCLTVAGLIFIYKMIVDPNRNHYVKEDNTLTEIIRKNYIDGFTNIKDTGTFTFSFSEEDINEVLSSSLEGVNDKHIESIYYSKGEDSHHFFYVDLDIPVVKTRVVIDTLAITPGNNQIYLAISSVTIGKLDAFKLLSDKGYLTSDFVSKLAMNANLPLSYEKDSSSFVLEPLSFIDKFPLGDISGMMFDFVKSDPTSISLDTSSLGFKVNFSKFSNPNHEDQAQTSLPNLKARIEEGLNNISYGSLPYNEPIVIASLQDKELASYFNESFVSVKDEEVTSNLTSHIINFFINSVNIEIIDAASIRLAYNVSVNGYLCNINQNIVLVSGGCDFDTALFLDVNIYSGSVTFEGINHPHVREMVNIIGEVLDKMNLLHEDDLSAASSNYSIVFDFEEEVMSAALSKDFNILMLETSVIPNPTNQTLDFCVIKRS